jgi:hypothetical protein
MRPVGIGNRGRSLDHISNCNGSCRLSKRIRSTGQNLEPFVQVCQGKRFGSQLGTIGRKIGDGRGAT